MHSYQLPMHSSQPTLLGHRGKARRYDPSTPRFAFGLAALALSAVMLSIFVIVPAGMEADAHEPAQLALSMRCSQGF